MRTITLGEALRLTMRNSPDIFRVDQELANQLAHATDVQLPPNPSVEADYFPQEEELRALGAPNEYDFTFKQQFRLSHLGMRQAYASALKRASRIEHRAEVIRVLNETVLLYYRYWMLNQRRRILDSAQRQAAEIVARIATAIERDETPSTQGNLFKAEVERFKAEIAANRAEEKEIQLQLLRAMGLAYQELRLAPPSLRPIPENTFTLLSFAQSRANLRELVLARQRAADRRQDVANLDIFPALTGRFLYAVTTDFEEPEYGGGLEVSIPIWDWNQAERQRAEAEKKVADAEADSLDRLSFDRIIEVRQGKAIAMQARAEAYWNQVVPAYEKAYDLTKHMFEQGQANMIQLWEVQQSLSRISNEALTATADALAARTLLEQALGGKIEEIPSVSGTNPNSTK
ncbi:MAG: TolC family protein [Verrucomicrobiota bacterium]